MSRDSFLPFASCRLCLLPARDPVACNSTAKADLFCRECALNDLVAQRKEIKRLEREAEHEKAEQEDEEIIRREQEQKKDLEDFERVSQGLEAKAGTFGRRTKRRAEEMHGKSEAKRKVHANGGAVSTKTEASFWVPGVDVSASNGHKADAKPAKLNPLCPASTPSSKHAFSLKGLTTVNFTEDEDAKGSEKTRICPSCKKGLSNSSKAMLAKPCGHVICGSCFDTFVKPGKAKAKEDAERVPSAVVPSMRCYVCETDLSEQPAKEDGKKEKEKDRDRIKPGVVEVSCEGTGFAGAGDNLTKREGTAFQC